MSDERPRCDHGGQEVICDFCGREYVCTPSDDHYHTPKGHQLCERCLVGDLPVREIVGFNCPRCGMVSFHPTDLKEGYCGNCHDWTGTT